MATGDIGATIDTLTFDATQGNYPHLIHISGDIYAIAYQGPDNDGWLITISIASNGQVGDAVIDSFEFDTAYCNNPRIIHISGDIYAIYYETSDNDGFIGTIDIDSSGNIGAAWVDSWEVHPVQGTQLVPIHITGTVYAHIFTDADSDGQVVTTDINADGTFTEVKTDQLEYDIAQSIQGRIIHAAGEYYAIVFRGADNDGWIVTVQIDSAGNIAAAITDSFEFDPAGTEYPKIVHIAGDVYAIAYGNSLTHGDIVTVEIDTSGNITTPVIDSWEFDGSYGRMPSFISVGENIFAIAYNGPDDDGWLVTLRIEDDGTLPAAVIDSLEFETVYCYNPSLIHVTGNVYAVAYTGSGNAGKITTLSIETPGGTTPHHMKMTGIGP